MTMETLGLIGTGKIGAAVMNGFCSEGGWQPRHVYISNRTKAKADALKASYPDRVSIESSNQDIIDKGDVIFIGLLPNVAREVLGLEACSLNVDSSDFDIPKGKANHFHDGHDSVR